MLKSFAGRRLVLILPSLSLAVVAALAMAAPASAQTVYREYEDGTTRELTDEDIRRLSIDRDRPNRDDDGEENSDERNGDSRDRNGEDVDQYYDEETGGGDAGEVEDRSDSSGGSMKDDDVADVTYFYEELENDGRWIEHSEYGYVWTPHRVADDWRPYSRGHWVMTDEHGWYWVSDEPFGWATYHYGRWLHDRHHGWVWVPGTRWGPAWVAWRESDDYVGWAPLPPDAYWEPSRRTVVMSDALYEGPEFAIYWSFLAPAYFLAPAPWHHYAPRHDVHRLVQRSRPHTHYAWRNRAIYNRGVPAARIARATHRPVPRLKTAVSATRPAARAGGRFVARSTVQIYRPDLSRRAVEARRKGRDIPGVVHAPAATDPARSARTAPHARPQAKAWQDIDRRVHKPAPRTYGAFPSPASRARSQREPQPQWGVFPPRAPPPQAHRPPPQAHPTPKQAHRTPPPAARKPATAAPARTAAPPPAPAAKKPAPPQAAAPPAESQPPSVAAEPPHRSGEPPPWRPDLGKGQGRPPGAGKGERHNRDQPDGPG